MGEDAFLGGKLKEDWIDNFRLGLRSYSAQFEATYNFVEENKGSGQIYVTGHSKGAANAIYACASFDNCTGVAFDGPGIGQALTREQCERLKNLGFINYVNEKDLVGAILIHPEQRIYVEHNAVYERNSDGSYVYETDANGNLVKKKLQVFFQAITCRP